MARKQRKRKRRKKGKKNERERNKIVKILKYIYFSLWKGMCMAHERSNGEIKRGIMSGGTSTAFHVNKDDTCLF